MNIFYSMPGYEPGAMVDNNVAIAKMLSLQHNVFTLSRSDNDISKIDASASFVYSFRPKKISTYFNLLSFRDLREFVDMHNVDAAFFQSNWLDLLTWKHLKGLPRVVYLHDPFPHEGVSLLTRSIQSHMTEVYVKEADAIIVSSTAMKNALLDHFPTAKGRVEVIRLGILENMKFDIKETSCDIDVLFFGRIEDYKGLNVLIEAAKLLSDETRIVVIGKGNLEKYSHEGILPKNMSHIDRYVPDRELAGYIQRSKVVVMPYISATGSQVIQIANYYERAVIASHVGGLPEYILDGETGLLIPPGNPSLLAQAIDSLVEDEVLWKGMGKAAFRYVRENYTEEALSKRYSEVLEGARKRFLQGEAQ